MKLSSIFLVLVGVAVSGSLGAQQVTALSCTPKRFSSDGSLPKFAKSERACTEEECGRTLTLPLDAAKKTDVSYEWLVNEEEDDGVYRVKFVADRTDGKYRLQKSKHFKSGGWYSYDISGTCEAIRVQQKF